MSVVMPDIDDAVITYLLTDTALGDIVSDRIYAERPESVVWPFVTAHKLSSRVANPRWLEAATIEIAAYGHRRDAHARRDAHDACEEAVRALNDLTNSTQIDAVICGVVATFGPRSVPDQLQSGEINPRFVAEVSLTYHPALLYS